MSEMMSKLNPSIKIADPEVSRSPNPTPSQTVTKQKKNIFGSIAGGFLILVLAAVFSFAFFYLYQVQIQMKGELEEHASKIATSEKTFLESTAEFSSSIKKLQDSLEDQKAALAKQEETLTGQMNDLKKASKDDQNEFEVIRAELAKLSLNLNSVGKQLSYLSTVTDSKEGQAQA
jgi:uncharacterized protein HemX